MAEPPGASGAPPPQPQRAYRAACPNCGAPVDFVSPASAFAVCAFCKSQVVRDGATLRRVGQSAELFDDHTPLQLGTSGRSQGTGFTLVGRLQYRTTEGTWNEWHALFANGRSAWLSEDNGRYVLAFDAPLAQPVPPPEALKPGAPVAVEGARWTVASVVVARLIAAEGELPAPPVIDRAFVVADLRNARDEVGTLDYARLQSPAWSIGRPVALGELAMSGLREVAEKKIAGRTLNCPACGTSVEVKLATAQSVVCPQCHAVIDLTHGLGADLKFYAQEAEGAAPLIPLGSIGQLAIAGRNLLPWQVVGYAERCDVPESDDDEQGFWREYLLYNRTEGFAFLVDAEDGWSWVAPLAGVPDNVGSEVVRHQGVAYRKLYAYKARVTWVLGEFYWKVERGQETFNTDYQGTGAGRARKLSREESRAEGHAEVVWSAGESIDVQTVRRAFRLPDAQAAALGRDAAPLAGITKPVFGNTLTWVIIVAVVLMIGWCSERDDCDDELQTFGEASLEYRNCVANRGSGSGSGSRGGSFGGFSGGGGHK